MDARPHVLLVNVDHWPGHLLGAAGHAVIQTPTLDQLARGGTRFTRAYSECPVCIPARRSLLTGTSPQTHGDRTFQPLLPMPPRPTIAQLFRDAGYQAYAVGKLHVYPPRARAGFDDVILNEEGRPQYGPTDDYELYLAERGFPGAQFLHGMSNNDYVCRPWHLPEDCHATTWTTRQMARMIQRRDPTRPGFWYLSYTHPHPPLAPLEQYWNMYRDVDVGPLRSGSWPRSRDTMPSRMNNRLIESEHYSPAMIAAARRAFYALCTHIDHQLRVVIGALREEGLLERTIVLFTSDHGDLLGDHELWAKRLFYEGSACVPMLLVGLPGDERVGYRRTDDRLVSLADVLPTLLELAGLPIPDGLDGQSMVGPRRRSELYGEYGEGVEATRMLHQGRWKLIYYPLGHRLQLFDLETDPWELTDLAGRPEVNAIEAQLTERLVARLYGSDLEWVAEGRLVGLKELPGPSPPNRDLALQRGSHWPVPPQS